MNWIKGKKFRNGQTTLTQDKIDKFTTQGFWVNRIMPDYVDFWANWEGERPALIYEATIISYGELKKKVDLLALALLELGLGSGDTLACQLPNRPEYLYFQYACWRLGIVFVPILPVMRHKEVEYMVRVSESNAMVVVDEWRGFNYPQMAKDIQPNLPEQMHIIVVGNSFPAGCMAYADLIDNAKILQEKYPADYLQSFRPDPNEICMIGFTSGTETLPKGVLSTHNVFVSQMFHHCRGVISQYDVVFGMNPLPHLFGALNSSGVIIRGGCTLIADFIPDHVPELIEKNKVTILIGAPPHFLFTLESSEFKKHDVSSVRCAAIAAAPIAPALLQRMQDGFPNMKISHGWGQTENGYATATHLDDPNELIIETDGFPELGNEIKVCDENGKELPLGKVGELYYRGPDLMVGFLNDTNRTLSNHLPDGFYKTGDLAVIRIYQGRRYQTQHGRSKDVISRGGEQISAKEVENLLVAHPKILDAAVVAMPDPILQERACAFIVLREDYLDITFDEMSNYLKEKNIAKFKIPERLEAVKQLPLTSTGKIQKFKLRQEIANKLLAEGRITEENLATFKK